MGNESTMDAMSPIDIKKGGTFIKYYKISQLIHTQSIAN